MCKLTIVRQKNQTQMVRVNGRIDTTASGGKRRTAVSKQGARRTITGNKRTTYWLGFRAKI